MVHRRILRFAPIIILNSLLIGGFAGGAVAAEEPLMKRSFENGRLTMQVPVALKPASEAIARLKYRGRVAARNILTDGNGAVNLLVRLGPRKFSATLVPEMAKQMRALMEKHRPGLVWHASETRTINGNMYAYLEFTSTAIDTKIRNFMLTSSMDGKLLVISFNVTVSRLARWQPVVRKILASVQRNK